MPEEEGGVTPPDPGTLPEEPDVIAPEPESERTCSRSRRCAPVRAGRCGARPVPHYGATA
jgi:hypothetical protein